MKNKISKIFDDLFPLPRSIMGKGYSDSLDYLKKFIPFKIYKFKTGTKIYDWKIPKEWQIKKAFIEFNGKKILDYKNNNLHVVNYSSPINKKINLKDLKKRIFFLKDQPTAIPYVTSYYKKNWGFCIKYSKYRKLKKGIYKTVIDSKFVNGYLKIGLANLKGKSNKIFLISSYLCHPSMANNELSGPMVAMCLINYFKKFKNEKSIRFIFIPETIGSIAYIKQNYDHLKKYVCGGYNLSCIGDNRAHSCMLSKFENSASDEALLETYKQLKIEKKVHSFLKRGSDERQYNSPGVDLPIASIFRTRYGDYPEYHTSLDNFDLVSVKGISGGFNIAKYAIINLQNKIIPSAKIYCEPQLGKRGLYPSISDKKLDMFSRNIVNILMYSNGRDSLEKISKIIKLNYNECLKLYKILVKNKLIN